MDHPNVMAGFRGAEDAGVYKISEELALIQTIDFFPPIVNDPYDFGKIAASNSLSDVYAMGGIPICALNIVAFPIRCLAPEILKGILQGGMVTLKEAEVPLIGGHSIEDEEIKYGLSVTGTIHPQKIIRNNCLKAGDALVLTKPIGTGVIATALKAQMAEPEHIQAIIKSMSSLNRKAAQVMKKFEVHACTDVTGFGLLGHAKEMVTGSGCMMRLYSQQIPLLKGALKYAQTGLIPGGAYRNKEFIGDFVTGMESIIPELQDLLVDPQTSGGLLISLPQDQAVQLVKMLSDQQDLPAAIIGEIVSGVEKIEIVP